MNLDKTIKSYFEEIASSAPTPGGGNVSAFSGALACNLGIMVCNLTIGKKKYLEVEEEIKDLSFQLESFKDKFLQLATEDNEAFENVMKAFKLPKDTDEQKKIRTEKIEEATVNAAVIPSQVIKVCRNVIPLLNTVAEKGNQNSVSDAGVAASLIATAAQGAYLNVMINCSSMNDKEKGHAMLEKSSILFEEVEDICSGILAGIMEKMQID